MDNCFLFLNSFTYSFVFLRENGVNLFRLYFTVFYSLCSMAKMDYVKRKKSLQIHIIDFSFWSEFYNIRLTFSANLNVDGRKPFGGGEKMMNRFLLIVYKEIIT